MIHDNLSDIVRNMDVMEVAVYKEVGETLAKAIWKEFEQLVKETPQWSGTSAASWNLSIGGSGGLSGVRNMPERDPKTALQKGHMHAVDVALASNLNSLQDLSDQFKPGRIRNAGIVVENYAPFVDITESGHVRDVNLPNGAFARFQERVAFMIFEPLRNRVL